ncbi:MAG: hypothetical protein GOMPHAMPRED_002283 [Gomphillus americanus]|uniref:Heme haloperoxidase family profile domain-containing protein n=1 Tax=Gomphillus americanus TaxID=1940652 RepID=A0A8H3IPK8_9LECA|nr:MAG: hypothetical protein GOMPHAMPRED_002283 [Gomphillus americanus]
MSSHSLLSPPLRKGEYVPSKPSDLRSPCPLINCLANHGYIARDGRNVHSKELLAAMNEIGLSSGLGAVFAKPIFLEHKPPKTVDEDQVKEKAQQSESFLGHIWYLVRNPWAVLFSSFGMRQPGQLDSMGKIYLDLNQLGQNGIVEHDISLTRDDIAQGDNITPQPDLVEDLLQSSSDGRKTLSMQDFASLRRRRIERQREENPAANYGSSQHQIACTEIALVLDVFGNGTSIPWNYAHAFFKEERLPVREGWKKRRWWSLGFIELGKTAGKVKKLVGITF